VSAGIEKPQKVTELRLLCGLLERREVELKTESERGNSGSWEPHPGTGAKGVRANLTIGGGSHGGKPGHVNFKDSKLSSDKHRGNIFKEEGTGRWAGVKTLGDFSVPAKRRDFA